MPGRRPGRLLLGEEDCDEHEDWVYLGAPEICDGKDNDCNGEIDDAVPVYSFYADADGDGFGDSSESVTACDMPAGYSWDGGDCHDGDTSVHPGAEERCYPRGADVPGDGG